MMNLQGSWVAMPTPFTEDNQVDIEGFKLLIARQIKYGTNQLFILGSAGEVTLLSIEEKKLIVKSVIAYMKDSRSTRPEGRPRVLQRSILYHRGKRGVCTVL